MTAPRTLRATNGNNVNTIFNNLGLILARGIQIRAEFIFRAALDAILVVEQNILWTELGFSD
jgi:hypothetical protein